MDALVILLTPLLIIIASILIPRQRTKGRKIEIFVIFLVIPFVIFFGDEIVGQAYLHSLCGRHGGYQYKELIRTDGYFDVDETHGCGLGCLEALTRRGFSYYETEVRYDYPNHANDKGFYKYYLASKDSELCAGGREIPREKGILPEDKCVAYIKVIEPSSRYEISMIRDSYIVDGPSGLHKVFSYVKDRKTNEIVASATSYRYWGGWLRNNSFGHNSATGCPSFQESHGAIENIILTSNVK